MKFVCRVVLSAVLLVPLSLVAEQTPVENTGPNSNIIREVSGRYIYRTLAEGRDRGSEEFQLTVHPDGSRTLMIWHDLTAKNAQFTVVLRVAEDFRPLTAFVSYWVESGYKGNTLFQVNGNSISAQTTGPAGIHTEVLEISPQFSIGTHPVAGDGWHLWYADAEAGQGKINLYSVEASPDLQKPILGQQVEMPWEFIGEEVIETPAGRFPTERYRLMGASDLWITGEDRLLVRMVQERFDREYLLVELE